jgi:hypothetical protein
LIFFDKREKLWLDVTFKTLECQLRFTYCLIFVKFKFTWTPSNLSSKWTSGIVKLFASFDIIGPMFVFNYLLKKSELVVKINYGIYELNEIQINAIKTKINLLFILICFHT